MGSCTTAKSDNFMNRTIIIFTILLYQISFSAIGQTTKSIQPDSTEYYFPIEVLSDTSLLERHDKFLNNWYSSYLLAMKEPKLFLDTSQSEIYRFTWLRTFHNPIAIRIERNGNNYKLYWKLCNGTGGYEPGQLTVIKQKTLDKAAWDEFINRVNQINFWSLMTNESEVLGSDGARWILEGKTSAKYHVVDRWTPSEKGNYYQCCDYLIGLTDLKIKGRDKY